MYYCDMFSLEIGWIMASRNAVGEMPLIFLNVRLNDEMLENPHSMAMSRILFLGPKNSVSARLILSLMR